MTRDSIRQIGVALATAVVVTTFTVGNIFQYYGLSTLDSSSKVNIYFLPARYTFSIWGVIFLGLIAYSIFQALPAQKGNPGLQKIGWWYIAVTLILIIWVFSLRFHNVYFTTLFMILVLIALLRIYKILDIGVEPVSRAMYMFVHIPFSIYMGWITMAVIGNISVLLFRSGWNGFGISDEIWAVVMMVVTIVIAELTAFNRQDLAYLAVFVWSFIGIAVNHYGVSPVFEAACVSAGIVLLITIITLIFRSKTRKKLV